MTNVNVAKLKAELSRYLEMATRGEEVIVTSHGQAIARLGPAQVVTTPPMNWKGFFTKHPPIKPKNKGTSARQLIHQMRDED